MHLAMLTNLAEEIGTKTSEHRHMHLAMLANLAEELDLRL
jgi:hypothetical protein